MTDQIPRMRRDPRARPAGVIAAPARKAALRRRADTGPVVFVVIPGAAGPKDAIVRLLSAARTVVGDEGLVWLVSDTDDTHGKFADRWVQHPAFGLPNFDIAIALEILRELDRDYRPLSLIFPDTVLGRDVAARLSATLSEGLIRDVNRLHGGRPTVYSFGAEFEPPPARILVLNPDLFARPNQIELCEGLAVPVMSPSVAAPNQQVGKIVRQNLHEIPLEDAPLVLAVGLGTRDIAAAQKLSVCLGAAFGATRPVCDAGLVPKERQIGASGRQVAPEIYIALGISGAQQHLDGISGARYIVAVNLDPNAPLMRKADKAIQADADTFIKSTLDALGGAR